MREGWTSGTMAASFRDAELAALQVIDRKAQQFAKIQNGFRHRELPEPINVDASAPGDSRLDNTVILRPTCLAFSTMPQVVKTGNNVMKNGLGTARHNAGRTKVAASFTIFDSLCVTHAKFSSAL